MHMKDRRGEANKAQDRQTTCRDDERLNVNPRGDGTETGRERELTRKDRKVYVWTFSENSTRQKARSNEDELVTKSPKGGNLAKDSSNH